MPKFVIERDVPGAGNLSDAEIKELAGKSVQAPFVGLPIRGLDSGATFNTSSMAFSIGMTQPSSQAVRPADELSLPRASSRFRSSLHCSAGVKGAPIPCRTAAAAPANRSERSDSPCAAAEQAKDSSKRAMPRLCSSCWNMRMLSRYSESAVR